jgi:hypothetical protein
MLEVYLCVLFHIFTNFLKTLIVQLYCIVIDLNICEMFGGMSVHAVHTKNMFWQVL